MKRKFKKTLLAVMILFSMIKPVYGSELNLNYTYYNLPYGTRKSEYDNFRIKKSISDGVVSEIINIEIDGKVGYCIEVGADLKRESTIKKYDQSFEDYLNSSLNNSDNVKKISDKINEYMYFGNKYLNSEHGQNYYAATQLLIWEELYKYGYRQDKYSSNVSLTLKNGEAIDLSNEKVAIKNDIKKYYTTPSMCSSDTTIELGVGETATYKDNNGVLSDYEVNCSENLRCQKNGNDLKVTVLNNEGRQTITFNKVGKGTPAILYKEGTEQGVVINDGRVGPVTCNFGIDTYKNAQTSGVKSAVIISIGLLFGLMAYLIYYQYQIKADN